VEISPTSRKTIQAINFLIVKVVFSSSRMPWYVHIRAFLTTMAVSGPIKESLNADTVLSKVSEYDIYRYYIGCDFSLGRAVISPFRKENNPSFSINIDKSGALHHIDFADSTKRGNCIDFVMQLWNLNYGEALKRIDRDMNLGILSRPDKGRTKPIYVQPDIAQRQYAMIQVVSRRFDSADLAYWASYGISEKELKANDVYAVKKYYLNKQLAPQRPTELVFGYLFDDRWKIYRPFSPTKKEKFITNVPNDRMSGMHRMTPDCNIGLVTKSKKDEMVLAKIMDHVCSAQSESVVSINSENIKLLTKTCQKVYLNFDSDEVGVQSCKYYNQFGFGWINCPKGYFKPDGTMIKDFADLARYHGLEKVTDHFRLKGLIS
jgi:hypothetical protein